MPPESKWDAFNDAADRADADMAFREVVILDRAEVYNPDTGRYETPDEPVEVARVNAEVREPTVPTVMTDASGTDIETDAVILLPIDTPVIVVAAGGETPASVLEDTRSGKRYRVQEIFYESTGQYRCRGVEQ